MKLIDLFFTPILTIIILLIGFIYKRTNSGNYLIRTYFFPGLIFKIIGSLIFALIYQFYYGYGDTFNFFKDSLVINRYMEETDYTIFHVFLLKAGQFNSSFNKYALKIIFFYDPAALFLEKITAFFNIFTFKCYSATSICFAVLSYTGIWKLFITMCKHVPALHKQFAISVIFIPSLLFWGSGILKDTLCIGAIGWLFYASYNLFIEKKNIIKNIGVLFISGYVLLIVKIYILMSFMLPLTLFIFLINKDKIRNKSLKTIITPLFYLVPVIVGVLSIYYISKSDSKYNLDAIINTSKITAEYIAKVSDRSGGATYDIGVIDLSSPFKMLLLIPNAIIVTLFRPFLWEVRNPVMLIASLESLFLLYLTLKAIIGSGFKGFIKNLTSNYFVLFCLLFSLVFAFSIGISTNNFGTMVRYKIPLIPFYTSSMYILLHYKKRSSPIHTKAGHLSVNSR